MVDVNRGTAGVYLPPQVASEIWADAQEQSFVMQRVPRTPLPGEGKTIQTITGDGVASFVGETERKPNVSPTFGTRTLRAHKIALTESFSDEFRRDKAALFNVLRPRMAGAIARTFDRAVLHGEGAPTGDFDTLEAAPEVSVGTNVYTGLLGALSSVAAAGGDVDGWALSPQGEILALGALDGNNRPLFIGNAQTDGAIGSLLGRPAYKSKSVYTAAATGEAEVVGIAGDWDSAMWGQVEAIKYEEYGGPIYTAAGELVHAGRQDNMFSIICEIEVGFIARDVDRFARLTGAAAL